METTRAYLCMPREITNMSVACRTVRLGQLFRGISGFILKGTCKKVSRTTIGFQEGPRGGCYFQESLRYQSVCDITLMSMRRDRRRGAFWFVQSETADPTFKCPTVTSVRDLKLQLCEALRQHDGG